MSDQSTLTPAPPIPPAPNLLGEYEIRNSHEIDESRQDRGPGRPYKYPWEDWLSGEQAYRLVRGKDYDCKTMSLLVMAKRHADTFCVKAEWLIDGPITMADEVTLWAVPDE